MKIFIVEGPDNVGKDVLIDNLYLEYKSKYNIIVRHFGAPPKNLDNRQKFYFQKTLFDKEFKFIEMLKDYEKTVIDYYNPKETLLIYNRFIYGEYIYGQLYRNISSDDIIENIIMPFELSVSIEPSSNINTYLICLNASDPSFLINNDDGKSFSIDYDKKQIEINLFNEIFNYSELKNKLKIEVDNNGQFKNTTDIFSSVKNEFFI